MKTQPKSSGRHFTHGTSASTADDAAQGRVHHEDKPVDAPHARQVKPYKGAKFDQLAEKVKVSENRQEALLDEAIEESFPGSDPISPKMIT